MALNFREAFDEGADEDVPDLSPVMNQTLGF
jgi:hypothetical protein